MGLKFSPNLVAEILQRHSLESKLKRCYLQKELLKRKISGSRVQLLPNLHETVVCTTINPRNKKILDVGFNVPEDLILNNFCKILTGLIRTPVVMDSGTYAYVTLKSIANADKTVYVYHRGGASSNPDVTFNCGQGYNCGTAIQIGSGTTAAARTNYCIETAFGSAPESGRIGTSTGSYGAGTIAVGTAFPAGGSGTINEVGMFGEWYDSSETLFEFMIFHDILASGVAFSAGELINISYLIST